MAHHVLGLRSWAQRLLINESWYKAQGCAVIFVSVEFLQASLPERPPLGQLGQQPDSLLTDGTHVPNYKERIPSAVFTAPRSAPWSIKSSNVASLTLVRCRLTNSAPSLAPSTRFLIAHSHSAPPNFRSRRPIGWKRSPQSRCRHRPTSENGQRSSTSCPLSFEFSSSGGRSTPVALARTWSSRLRLRRD